MPRKHVTRSGAVVAWACCCSDSANALTIKHKTVPQKTKLFLVAGSQHCEKQTVTSMTTTTTTRVDRSKALGERSNSESAEGIGNVYRQGRTSAHNATRCQSWRAEPMKKRKSQHNNHRRDCRLLIHVRGLRVFVNLLGYNNNYWEIYRN